MVAPCDKYQGLVVGPDGQTVADPYGLVPTLGDYEEWRAVVLGLIEQSEAELQREREVRGTVAPDDAAAVEALRVRWDELGNAFVASFDWDITWGPDISRMVQLGQDAACQLGIVEARIVAAGGSEGAPKPAKPRPSSGGKATGKGMGVGLVVALVVLGSIYMGGER